jgi:serine/threonine protein kinase
LVHEFIVGKPLLVWRRSSKPTRDERLRVAMRIGDGLNAAHNAHFVADFGFEQQGVVHGDVKPDNILVRGVDCSPALVDFMIPDIQRLIASPALRNRVSSWRKTDGKYRYSTPSTAAFGTPGYMPPEQALDGIVTPVSDIYALGRTFAQLFWDSPLELVARKSRKAPDKLLVARPIELYSGHAILRDGSA